MFHRSGYYDDGGKPARRFDLKEKTTRAEARAHEDAGFCARHKSALSAAILAETGLVLGGIRKWNSGMISGLIGSCG